MTAKPAQPFSAGEIRSIREDFPILATKVHDKPLVYFDNAATSLKPKSVVEAVSAHYLLKASNVHRGVHFLSEQATTEYEATRDKVRALINAGDRCEILFTRGTTESINVAALSLGQNFIQKGDVIVLSEMEHHSNIVPWQMLRERTGCVIKVIPVDDDGGLRLDEYEKLLSSRVKLVAVTCVSNALGTVNPAKKIVRMAKANGALVLIDAAQAVPHMPVDVRDLDCDFLAFSGHKMFGPTGTGVLYGKRELLEKLPPVFGGGDMIETVTFEKTTYNVLPHKFEAGTPHIAGVIGLGAAIDYLNRLGLERVHESEQKLLRHATARMRELKGLRIIGTAEEKAAVVSFTLAGAHPHDLGTLLDLEGIAVRTGHHCTQPLMRRFGVPATARASFAVYNTEEEIDAFVQALQKIQKLF